MKFELLLPSHAEQLYRFECENKTYFESLIAPRDPRFYSVGGVRAHIKQLEVAVANRLAVPFVLMVDEEIIARANLKNVCTATNSAEVGYRVAKIHIGRGVASACLQKLLREAADMSEIRLLRANVLDNNPASKRILAKQGFTEFSYEPKFIQINGKALGNTVLQREIAAAG